MDQRVEGQDGHGLDPQLCIFDMLLWQLGTDVLACIGPASRRDRRQGSWPWSAVGDGRASSSRGAGQRKHVRGGMAGRRVAKGLLFVVISVADGEHARFDRA